MQSLANLAGGKARKAKIVVSPPTTPFPAIVLPNEIEHSENRHALQSLTIPIYNVGPMDDANLVIRSDESTFYDLFRPKVISLLLQEIAKNALMAFGPIRSIRLRRPRTAQVAPSPEALFTYAYRLPSLVLRFYGSVAGKDILEVGPGDHLAVGLTFLALGARSYTALDRFRGQYSSPTSKQWYCLARDGFAGHFCREWPTDLSAESFPDHPAVRMISHAVESAPHTRAHIVCSHNVGEHITDLHAFAAFNASVLHSGGIAIHVVDFGGHNWQLDERDPLLFRRIPSWLWKAMGSNRGYPNRVPYEQYLDLMQQSGLSVEAHDLKRFTFHPSVQEASFVCRPLPRA